MRLEVENPKTSERFAACLKDLAPLPWRVENGMIYDANDQPRLYTWQSRDETNQLLTLAVLAVNTCGGFRLEADQPEVSK